MSVEEAVVFVVGGHEDDATRDVCPGGASQDAAKGPAARVFAEMSDADDHAVEFVRERV